MQYADFIHAWYERWGLDENREGFEAIKNPEYIAIFAPFETEGFNWVFANTKPATVDTILGKYGDKNFFWAVPNNLPVSPDFKALKLPFLFVRTEMALNAEKPYEQKTSLVIKEMKTPKDAKDFAQVDTFDEPGKYEESLAFALEKMKQPTITSFVGYENNVPVAIVSAINIKDIVASGIFKVLVLPEHREKGYGHDICVAAINCALRNDSKQVFLDATDMAVPLYQKLGFKTQQVNNVYNHIAQRQR